MDDKLISQPNWHSEIYRTLTPKLDVTRLERYLDFIEVSEDDGHILIGSSNLTGRSWYGSVWYYENIDLACQLTTYVANKTISSGVVDGRFILNDSSKMIIIDDSGCIQIMTLPENGDEPDDKLQLYKISEEHENIITDIALHKNKNHYNQFITSSMDCSIKLWDIEYTRVESNEYLNSLKTYSNAHNDIITSIDTHHINNNIFISASLDHNVLLWDVRVPTYNNDNDDNVNNTTCCKLIYKNEFCGLTNIKYVPNNDNLITITNESGDLYIIDIRGGSGNGTVLDHSQYLYKLHLFNNNIYKMKYNYNNNNHLLAICADNNHIIVLNMNNIINNREELNKNNIIYSNDNKHNDIIRGLAWITTTNSTNDTTLLTCGWDQHIYKHTINI